MSVSIFKICIHKRARLASDPGQLIVEATGYGLDGHCFILELKNVNTYTSLFLWHIV